MEGHNLTQSLELSRMTILLQAWSRNKMKGLRMELMVKHLLMVPLLMLLICILAGMVGIGMIQNYKSKGKRLILLRMLCLY